jgi:uncharacterized membrane protein YeaQ/YmgE (transglycosylase-associated protein family)
MLGKIIVWLIVGALAGNLIGMLIKGRKKGFGILANIGIGMAGALIGGAIFWVFRIDLGLGRIAISFEDLIAACIGSLIFVFGMWVWNIFRKDKMVS